MPKPTLARITAADGTTLVVTTRIAVDGTMTVALYRGDDPKGEPLMRGEFTAAGEGR